MKLDMNMSMGTLLGLIGKKVRCIEEPSIGFNIPGIKEGQVYTVINAKETVLGVPVIVVDGDLNRYYVVELFEIASNKLYKVGGNV